MAPNVERNDKCDQMRGEQKKSGWISKSANGEIHADQADRIDGGNNVPAVGGLIIINYLLLRIFHFTIRNRICRMYVQVDR